MGSVEATERRAMLEAFVLAAARPAAAGGGGSAPQGEAAVEEGEGGLRRREKLAVDPRPAELQRQEEELRKAQRVRGGQVHGQRQGWPAGGWCLGFSPNPSYLVLTHELDTCLGPLCHLPHAHFIVPYPPCRHYSSTRRIRPS